MQSILQLPLHHFAAPGTANYMVREKELPGRTRAICGTINHPCGTAPLILPKVRKAGTKPALLSRSVSKVPRQACAGGSSGLALSLPATALQSLPREQPLDGVAPCPAATASLFPLSISLGEGRRTSPTPTRGAPAFPPPWPQLLPREFHHLPGSSIPGELGGAQQKNRPSRPLLGLSA